MPRKSKKTKKVQRKWIASLILIFGIGILGGYFIFKTTQPKENEIKDKYLAFLMEVYDKVQENYWDDINDENLTNLYKLGAEKVLEKPFVLGTNDKEGLQKTLVKTIETLGDDEKKKEFSVNLASIVLANLKPFSRSGLYTTQKKQELKNMVENVNPEKDLYQDLEVEKQATEQEIEQAFEEKVEKLEEKKQEAPTEQAEEIEKEIEEAEYAHEVLSDEENKEKYDETGAEPTVFAKLLLPEICLIRIQRISPATFEDFKKEANSIEDKPELDTLILDLRGNIGGSIDLLPWFLGPFIGKDQYAYDFFHKKEYTPFKTKAGWLASMVKYKKVVVLVDEQTQSSAEVMTAVFKKYNVGVVIGLQTKGWGTVEKVFEIENQIDPNNEIYSAFLVHSLTLRDDGQPIEGHGVDPTININDPNWEKQLLSYFNYKELVEVVKKLWNQ